MKFCTNCGQQLDDAAVFCTNCGMRFEVPQEVARQVDDGMTMAAIDPIPEPEPVIPDPVPAEIPEEPVYEAPAYEAPAYDAQPEFAAQPVYAEQPVYEAPPVVEQPAPEPPKKEKKKKGPWMILTFVAAGVGLLGILLTALISGAMVRTTRNALLDTTDALNQKSSQLSQVQSELDSVKSEKATLESEYAAIQEQLDAVGGDMDAVTAKLEELNEFIDEIRYDTTGYLTHDYMISDGVIVLGTGESKVVDLYSNIQGSYTIRYIGDSASVKFEEAEWNQHTTIRVQALEPGLTIATMTNSANSDTITILVYVVE